MTDLPQRDKSHSVLYGSNQHGDRDNLPSPVKRHLADQRNVIV